MTVSIVWDIRLFAVFLSTEVSMSIQQSRPPTPCTSSVEILSVPGAFPFFRALATFSICKVPWTYFIEWGAMAQTQMINKALEDDPPKLSPDGLLLRVSNCPTVVEILTQNVLFLSKTFAPDWSSTVVALCFLLLPASAAPFFLFFTFLFSSFVTDFWKVSH